MTNTDASKRSPSVRAYVEMTKPRIIELLLVTTVPAMVVASGGWPGIRPVLVALIGGSLSAGGANVINQVYDADIDAVMGRTKGRPLPTGRVSSSGALVFGVTLGVLGSVVLAIGTTVLAGVLAAVAYLFYVFVYTMVLKRSTTQNIVIGGAAGAIPALIGWAAITGSLSLAAWVMFAIIFFWTPPHFWALSLKYEAEYRAADIPMLSVVAGEQPTLDAIRAYSFLPVGMSLMLIPVADLGWLYAVPAVGLGAALVWLAFDLRSDRTKAMRYFGFTNLYLAGVFLAMMVDALAGDSSALWSTVWIVVGAALALAGAAMVARLERGAHMRVAGVSPLRHAAEVALSIGFAIVMVVVCLADVL
ncbi:MAG: heme o synthase [Acidimicrobiia bacterium]